MFWPFCSVLLTFSCPDLGAMPSPADLSGPLCGTLPRSINGHFSTTQASLACLITCLSHADLNSLIPWFKPPRQVCSDPCLNLHSALPTYRHTIQPESRTEQHNSALTCWPHHDQTVYNNGHELCLQHQCHLCPYLTSCCNGQDLTSHIPLTVWIIIDDAWVMTWTERKVAHGPSSHRKQTQFIIGNSTSFTDVTPGLSNSNNHLILQRISNLQ